MKLINSSIIIILLLLAVYGLFLTQPINMVTADLGRHIKNGEVLFQNPSVLKTNFYAYTQPDFPTINHHWLSGLAFYGVWKLFDFKGVHLFFILISLATFYIFFRIAVAKSSAGIAGLVALPIVFILLERFEIRPEIFSYLLAGIFLGLLIKIRDKQIKEKYLWLLPILQILWANLHIYFFLGPLLIGVFLIESFIKKSPLTKGLGLIFIASIVATTLTPFGLNSTLAPLTIFQNFGYHLVENQTVWFIEKILPQPRYIIFQIFFALFSASIVWRWLKEKKLPSSETILGLIFGIMACLAIRNFTLFGLLALPLTAENIALTIKPLRSATKINVVVITCLAIFLLATFSGELEKIYPYSRIFGLGVESGNSAAAEFFKKENIQGPIFNNYDIGGYLIFHLGPREKVFVDNRPEAYPADFFTQIYIPMQENKKIWDEQNSIYKFNAIIFSYRDYTPWGQAFFRRILEDPDWTTVFANSRVIILLKNNELNKNIIAQYGKSIRVGHQTTK